MSKTPPTYIELRDVAFAAFEYAKTKRGFTDLQAFSFTHDHLGIYIEGNDSWLSLIGSTAAFIVAVQFDVDLSADPLFSEYVFGDLKKCYMKYAFLVFQKIISDPEFDRLSRDMQVVAQKFIGDI